jgi:hypothetical protein
MNKLHQVFGNKPPLASNAISDIARQKTLALAGLILLFPLSIIFCVSAAKHFLAAIRCLFSA